LLSIDITADDPIYTRHLQQLADVLGGGARAQTVALAQMGQQLSQHAMLSTCLDYFQIIADIGLIGAIVAAVQCMRSFRM
jgi:hypothetical protein